MTHPFPTRRTSDLVVQGHDHPWLLGQSLQALDASWVAGHAPEPGEYSAKTRYRQTDSACSLGDAVDDGFSLSFTEDQWAVTPGQSRSEEHTSELQSLMRISYAVFCLKKKNK